MNPVLLKPQSEVGAQIIVQGFVHGTARARDYQAMKRGMLPRVLESFHILRETSDLVLVEGAGSASEINLRRNDIANMGFARAADLPVVLIGDIDRGGVIASLVGTKSVLDPADAALIAGFIVNRMRGDISLFADGMAAIAARTGWAPLGLVPHFPDAARLPAEDAADIVGGPAAHREGRLKIAVPLLPHIANFDDLDPLAAEPEVALSLVPRGTPLPVCDLMILPGSKATIADLAAFRAEGWDIDLYAHRRRGGAVLGICGGLQMLGTRVADPDGVEGPPGAVDGLSLLDVSTILGGDKTLVEARGTSVADGAPVRGYEMHMGRTEGPDRARPVFRLSDGRADGAASPDGRVLGTYLHGLFADDAQRGAWLRRFGATSKIASHDEMVETILDRLAAHLEAHVDVNALITLAR